MKKLPVDISEVAWAMEDSSGMQDYYLDTKTGRVLVVPLEESLLAGDDVDDGFEGQDATAEDASGDDELRPSPQDIDADPERYAPIPTVPSREAYDLMVEFAKGVEDRTLRRMLQVALNGRGAFRRFKDVLLEFPQERERWFAMKDAFFEEQVREWLASIGIEPATEGTGAAGGG